MISALPPDSALGRKLDREHREEHYEGHEYTQLHAQLWWMNHRLQELIYYAQLQTVKKPSQVKPPKLLKFPWSEEDTAKKYGRVEPGDERAAVDYLLGLGSGKAG